jgi:hypothetical protein
MVLVKNNKKRYVSAIYGRGINGKYSRYLKKQGGYGIMADLGANATKAVLGGIGKSTGSYYGKQLGKLIEGKTGSKLLGTVAKAGLSSLGGLAGERLGSLGGKQLGKTVFSDKEKEKKKKEEENPKPGLSQLLDMARNKITGGSGMQNMQKNKEQMANGLMYY